MSSTDSVSDYLTRIRNAAQAGHKNVKIPYSNLKQKITELLVEKGYVSGFSLEEVNTFKVISLNLKYLENGEHAIKEMKKVSSPGQRVYKGKDISKYLSGLGLYILSTSKGIKSDKESRLLGIGGEVLFKIC